MIFARTLAQTMDVAMCFTLCAVQRRHRIHASSRDELAAYIDRFASSTRDEHFAHPEIPSPFPALAKRGSLQWPSPIPSGFAENDRVHVDFFPCLQGWQAPTVIFLHALMSTSDVGYRGWATRFNDRGWNACFVHLPYHYSRKPRRRFNGELAITADLVRTAEGLRQGVCELRQLMALLRSWGGSEFALWASSYGGWIGALLASVEHDFRFVALLEPIVNVEHAIWVSPAGAGLRRELVRHDIDHALIERHFHLTSPSHAEPLCGGERVVFCAGDYDLIALPGDILRLHEQWRGSELLRVAQGHFGYRMMRTTWARLCERKVI